MFDIAAAGAAVEPLFLYRCWRRHESCFNLKGLLFAQLRTGMGAPDIKPWAYSSNSVG